MNSLSLGISSLPEAKKFLKTPVRMKGETKTECKIPHKTMAKKAEKTIVKTTVPSGSIGLEDPSLMILINSLNMAGLELKMRKKIPKNAPPTTTRERSPIPKILPMFLARVLPCLKKIAAPSQAALAILTSLR